MAVTKAFEKLYAEVDKFLEDLIYENLIYMRPGDIYGMLYINLSKLSIKYFDNLDATHNIEINVRKDMAEQFVELTGYIKVEGRFIGIDSRYNARKKVDVING